jgi:hypothetical protein
MLVPLPVACPACGELSTATVHVTKDHAQHSCPHCGAVGAIHDPLSVSVVAERLLVRVQSEIDKGDFTIAIVLSAMAVETALIQAYLKWKAIEHYAAGGPLNPPAAVVETWEACYRVEARGFDSGVKFVGKFLVGKTFNSFVSEKQAAAAQPTWLLTAGTIQKDLFDKRNAAMHRGKMNFSKDDAEKAHAAAIQAIRTVKWMDEDKYQAEEKARRDELYAASQPTV